MSNDYNVLKGDELFVVCDDAGDIVSASAAPGAGFYFRDMRHLSVLTLRIEGSEIEQLDSATRAIDRLSVYLSNADPLRGCSPDHPGDAMPQTLGIVRQRSFDGAMRERISVTNHNRFAVRVCLSMSFAADFRDLFDIRGLYMQRDTRPTLPEAGENDDTLSYVSVEGTTWITTVRSTPRPSSSEIHAGADYGAELRRAMTRIPGHDRVVEAPAGLPAPLLIHYHDLSLAPGSTRTIEYEIEACVRRSDGSIERPRPLASESGASALSGWDGALTKMSTSNALFDQILHRSQSDLRALVTPLPNGGSIIAAGIPWYVAPFGRDSAIAARQLLPFNALVAAATLRYLASTQGRVSDAWREEQPGKIIHEVRFGEMARRSLVPHSRYFGTVDATPLFLLLFADYLDWTDDRALFDELRQNIELALGWIDRFGDSNDDGFVDYARHSARGLDNQGWKDSDDSLQRPDGQPIPGPIGLVEAQGYVHAAKAGLARHLERYGEATQAQALRIEADQLRERIERAFWSEDTGYYAEAIDGDGRRVETISSNPAHLLRCGVPAEHRALRVVERLFRDDMFSGWGVRALSADMGHYNPMSYHNGSVWPHDNGFILWGLRRYRRFGELDRLATALFDAATSIRFSRLPELMCGFPRGNGDLNSPVSYPVSCSPQAWAAGVPFVMLETLLGLRADAARNEIALDPWLPAWLERVELRGLRVGQGTVSLTIAGRHDDVHVRVDASSQNISVVID